jgi:hypothetical protein
MTIAQGQGHELAHDTGQTAARAPKWMIHVACATCECGDREFELAKTKAEDVTYLTLDRLLL